MSEVLKALSAPFRDEQIRYRIGATNANKVKKQTGNNNAKATSGMALAYIDARDVYDRLDEVCGASWACEHRDAGDGRLSCSIGIMIDGERVWRSDGAGGREATKGLSSQDSNKGDFSDAVKRAAVAWGIGRYLYDMKNQWVKIDDWGQIADGMREILDRSHAILAKGKMPPAIAHESNVEPIKPQSKQVARENGTFTALLDGVRKQDTIEKVDRWEAMPSVIAARKALPKDWATNLTEEISKHKDDIFNKQAAA